MQDTTPLKENEVVKFQSSCCKDCQFSTYACSNLMCDCHWPKSHPKKDDWEERFDNRFHIAYPPSGQEWDITPLPDTIKSFIRQELINRTREEQARIKAKIGALRQWLNEDRIDDPHKMVKNSDIELWLFGADYSSSLKERIERREE